MITDYIALGALLYFFLNGWYKGIFKTLLGPISLIIGCSIAFIYYHQTNNMALSLWICVLSPLAFKILITVVLKIWKKVSNKEVSLSFSSKLFGSIFSVLWSGGYLGLLLILIGLIPTRFGWLDKIQDDVIASKSYSIIQQFIDKNLLATFADIKKLTAIIGDPAKFQKFQSTKEFEVLMEDDDLKEIFSDEEMIAQIRNKEYGKLLANPKMRSALANDQLLKKIFALNKKIMEEGIAEETSNGEKESQPKVIEIK